MHTAIKYGVSTDVKNKITFETKLNLEKDIIYRVTTGCDTTDYNKRVVKNQKMK